MDCNNEKAGLEAKLKKAEQDFQAMHAKAEEEAANVTQLQKRIKGMRIIRRTEVSIIAYQMNLVCSILCIQCKTKI